MGAQGVVDLIPLILCAYPDCTFPFRSMARMRGACPPNVILVRQKSAWNNASLCAKIIKRLVSGLAHVRDRFQPVLLLDAHRIHWARAVLEACTRGGIFVVLIPPLLTWLLQPLDTHAFARYKHWLRIEFQRARSEKRDHDLTIEEFLPCVHRVVKRVLEGISWASAFDDDGFGANQQKVSNEMRRQIFSKMEIATPCPCPTPAELSLCFPRRAIAPLDVLTSQLHNASSVISQPRPVCAAMPTCAFPRGVPLGMRSSILGSALRPSESSHSGPYTRSQRRTLK